MPATIDDPSTLETITEMIGEWLGEKKQMKMKMQQQKK
jgi:hypothetical protein